MKPTKAIIVLLIGLLSNCITAQESSLKIESLPIDKKTNCYIRYYYFPNLEAYFDNLKQVFYYKVKGRKFFKMDDKFVRIHNSVPQVDADSSENKEGNNKINSRL